MRSPLLPERHPVRDFFVLDTMDVVPRSDLATMEHPIFSLSTHADTKRISYENGGVRVEIIPSAIGLPTVFDKDILIYCISKLIAMRDAGVPIGPCVRLTTHDMLVDTNRPTNNLGYERLLPALNRLRGVVINTTIATGGLMTTRGFGLIDDFEYNRKGSMFAERLKHLEVRLSDWLFRAIAAAEVLPISRDYFRLRAPVDRRIYEVARKHCGRQASWRIGLELLQRKVGSTQAGKFFSRHLRKLILSNHLPDYAVTLEGSQAVFYRRDDGKTARQQSGAPSPVATTSDRPAGQALERRLVRVSQEAVDQLSTIAPGWDRYGLESLYCEWAAELEVARSEDARFLAWARSYTKGKATR
mgnify:CR=1 FL=1